MQLNGKSAVVTGGANGIGRALCERFASEGAAAIVVADIDVATAHAVAERITTSATRAMGVRCDVSNEADVQSLVAVARDFCGEIDLFVSNAGITVKGGCEVPDADWQRLWAVNVMGHVYACRAVLPAMLERGEGYLVTTASAAGLLTEIGSAAYSATKHAAVALAEWLSVTYRRRGIKVSCLCPAGVATDFLDLSDPVHQFLNVGAITPEQVATFVVAALDAERFLVLPHPEVEELIRFKATDLDKWLHNFSRLSDKLRRREEKRPSK